MNSSISKARIGMSTNEEQTRLSSLERTLLLLPTAGGLVFGISGMVRRASPADMDDAPSGSHSPKRKKARLRQ